MGTFAESKPPPMYVVSYEIIGAADAPETGTASAFELEGGGSSSSSGTVVPTVRALREGFPYEGRFHFRAKVPCPGGGDEEDAYAWLDLTDADAPLPVWREEAGQEHVHVRVLPLALPPAGDDAAEGEGETLDYSGGELDDDIFEASYGQGSEDQPQPSSYDYHRQRQGSGGSDGGSGGGGVGAWSQSLKEATETVLTADIFAVPPAEIAAKRGKSVEEIMGDR